MFVLGQRVGELRVLVVVRCRYGGPLLPAPRQGAGRGSRQAVSTVRAPFNAGPAAGVITLLQSKEGVVFNTPPPEYLTTLLVCEFEDCCILAGSLNSLNSLN